MRSGSAFPYREGGRTALAFPAAVGVGVEVGPHVGVERTEARLDERPRAQIAVAVRTVGLAVARVVMYEEPVPVVTERRVRSGVEDERVPGVVDGL